MATDDEMGKVLHGLLMEGATQIAIDNQPVGEMLDSGSLASAVTAGFVTRRVLGSPQTATASIRGVLSVNGNKLQISPELARRTLPIFFDTETPHPDKRPPSEFKYPELEATVEKHRGLLVWCCLTLVANWLVKNRPPFSGDTLSSFEPYTRTMGGILEAAGVLGFMSNRKLIAETDVSDLAMKAFAMAWWERFAGQWTAVGTGALARPDGCPRPR